MNIHINVDSQIGNLLGQRLGLTLPRREGHDLAGACVTCKSSDAFRLHMQTGVAQCYSCGAKWSPFQLAEAVLKDRNQAKSLLIDLGVMTPDSNHNGQAVPANPLEIIACQKGVSAAALAALGATPLGSTTVLLPAFGPDGKSCTTFSMATKGGKGLFAKGKPAGLFFPHRDGQVYLPRAGEVWHLVEGPKDAAALHDLGLLTCGMNTCRLAAKFARLFKGAEIVLVPDRDRAGEDGASFSARVLRGVAKSVRIAVLPAEFKESNGDDVRDILRRRGGRDLVLQAIADAQPWEPTEDEHPSDDRAEIEVTPDEYVVNDEAVDAIKNDASLFQRGNSLVQIQHDYGKKTLKGITRPANSPRIVPVREASLRE